MESLARETGIAITVWTPAIVSGTSYTPQGFLVTDSLAERVASYSHRIRADGGWWSASLTFNASPAEIDDWYENGVGRHVAIHNPAGEVVWAGFVDVVTIDAGALTVSVGPLLEVVNRASVLYTPILTTGGQTGAQTETTIAEEATSQGLYGILEEVITGSELWPAAAEQYRDTYLAERSLPMTDHKLSTEGREGGRITLDLQGYVHFLKRYITETVSLTTTNVRQKILDALGDDPNGLLSTDYTYVEANPLLVHRDEQKRRTAWNVIAEAVALGDASDVRYLFGVYDDQTFYYQAAPDTAEYQHHVGQPTIVIEELDTGKEIAPEDVLPGRWLFLPDFLPSLTVPRGTPIRRDHRYVFVEEIEFSAPNVVDIVGGRLGTVGQWLAKKGLGV